MFVTSAHFVRQVGWMGGTNRNLPGKSTIFRFLDPLVTSRVVSFFSSKNQCIFTWNAIGHSLMVKMEV